MSLKDNAHQLSREHLKMDRDGKAHKVPALLEDLRRAVTPGHAGSAGGGLSGPPIPINPNALDLLAVIEGEARRSYYEVTNTGWQSTLEELLQEFAALDLTPEWDAYMTHVSLEWIDQITAMLWPEKPRRKLVGKRCPACGQSVHGDERKTCLSLGCWDDEGNMRPIGTWDIECASCEAAWSGNQVAYLLRALDTPGAIVISEEATVKEEAA
jgi:hypothetical protein